jgi:hypothetical protein
MRRDHFKEMRLDTGRAHSVRDAGIGDQGLRSQGNSLTAIPQC